MALNHFRRPNLWQNDEFGQRAELMAAIRGDFALVVVISAGHNLFSVTLLSKDFGIDTWLRGAYWLVMEASCVCFFWGLMVLWIVEGGQRRRFCGVSRRFSCSRLHVCVFADTQTSQTSLNILLQHMLQQKPQIQRQNPSIFKKHLRSRLENVPFPLCSQLSDGVLKSKPLRSTGTLWKSCPLTVH